MLERSSSRIGEGKERLAELEAGADVSPAEEISD